jgi:Zn-dependent oligopeptidase
MDMFHEMGHFIHYLFCKIPLKNYPKDFFEIPSTLFENFIKSKDVLKILSKKSKSELIDDNLVFLITKWFESNEHINNNYSLKKALVEIELYETQDDNQILEIIQKNICLIADEQFFSSKLNQYSYLYAKKKSEQLYNQYFRSNELNKKYGKNFRDNFLSINDDKPLNIFNNFIQNKLII